MHPCLHILQYTCIHEHPHNKDSIIIFNYILLFCTLYAIGVRLYVHLTATSSHNRILFDVKLKTPPSPVSCRTSVAIIPYYINGIKRKQDSVVYKMSHALKLWELLCLIKFRWRRRFPWNVYTCLYLPVCTYICSSDAYVAYIGLHVFISADMYIVLHVQCSFELTYSYMCQYLLIYA